jgi:uncharacterized protein YjaZ
LECICRLPLCRALRRKRKNISLPYYSHFKKTYEEKFPKMAKMKNIPLKVNIPKNYQKLIKTKDLNMKNNNQKLPIKVTFL